MVPFDLADELHLKFDAVAINYRRTMQQEILSYYPDSLSVSGTSGSVSAEQ